MNLFNPDDIRLYQEVEENNESRAQNSRISVGSYFSMPLRITVRSMISIIGGNEVLSGP